jgi:predicted ATPase
LVRDLPIGTVTFLFTDIEGSTRLLQELGAERYASELAGHRRVLREAFERHGGVEVDTQGDAFFVAFPTAPAALEAAREAQEELALPVRMGLHTGTPLLTDEGYVGADVHRAARIAAAGHGRQVLVSVATASLVDADLLRDLGEHRLKDLTRPERLFQLGDGDFPPLKSLNRVNLPIAAAPLIGRSKELSELSELVRCGRVITVTGAGGSGKTRIALQVAAELAGEFAGGVHFVPLAGLREPELVTAQILATLAVPQAEHLVGVKALLVLDNAEHLLAAAPDLSQLLAGASGLKLLVTSRAPLRIQGEREYALDTLGGHDAVALFSERARAVRADFVPDQAAAEICVRLDRLPLALELAAARLRSLDTGTLLERLEQRLPMLTAGRRDAPERQRTLRATIDWSYDLLDPSDQEAFERVAVLVGSFSLTAAETVAGVNLEQLDDLVELSLLKPLEGGRFLMLETVREYALDRLGAPAGLEQLLARHAEFFATLAEQADTDRFTDPARLTRQVESDYDNFRLALQWTREHEAHLFVQLAGALGWFWLRTARLEEGRDYLDTALTIDVASPAARARAEVAAGSIWMPHGEPEQAEQLITEGLTTWRELGDDHQVASSLMALGWVHLALDAAGREGAAQEARHCFEEALSLWEIQHSDHHVQAVNALCMVDIEQGRITEAEDRAEAALEHALQTGNPATEQIASHYLGDCALLRGDYRSAERRYRRCLQLTWKEGFVRQSNAELIGYAMSIAGQGRSAEALRLAGAWQAFRNRVGIRGGPRFWLQLQERELGRARRHLSYEEADHAWNDGLEMTLEEAVTSVIGNPTATAPPTPG